MPDRATHARRAATPAAVVDRCRVRGFVPGPDQVRQRPSAGEHSSDVEFGEVLAGRRLLFREGF